MNNEMIKQSIKELNTNWTWEAVESDENRKALVDGKNKRMEVVVTTAEGEELQFVLGYRPEDKNLRIFTRNKTCMLQWRTDITTGRGNRFILAIYGTGNNPATASIVNHADFCDNPLDMKDEDATFLEMMYPEVAELVKYFGEALSLAQDKFNKGDY